eukprot:TRINITY_DN45679_c0_g1_i1.p1 TRINITY_DN45679_c0_g1~~TRINITY_DN45679_c0_g1_i1.p1  ORF type:complete len:324 (-),score=45.77 TRINITY_DN45679_c0_g1_i1:397-1284(-)
MEAVTLIPAREKSRLLPPPQVSSSRAPSQHSSRDVTPTRGVTVFAPPSPRGAVASPRGGVASPRPPLSVAPFGVEGPLLPCDAQMDQSKLSPRHAQPLVRIASPPPPLKACVVFDFDSTLTSPVPMPRLGGSYVIADRPELMSALTDEEVFVNFGGAQRVARLKSLLEAMTNAGVAIFIVSLGLKRAILPHLAIIGLARVFRPDRVFGQDTNELRSRDFVKGKLIKEVIMDPKGWGYRDVLFVDDSEQHIRDASQICECLHVPPGKAHGINEDHLAAIRKSVFGVTCGQATCGEA